MHTHFSAISALSTFLAVVFLGTIWRLASAHLTASHNPTFQRLGMAMAFQY